MARLSNSIKPWGWLDPALLSFEKNLRKHVDLAFPRST